MSRQIKALFFDFDGTLVNSLPILYQLYMRFLASFGHTGSRSEFESLNGTSQSEAMLYLRQRYQLPLGDQEIKRAFGLLVQSIYEKEVELFEGTAELLAELSDSGFELTIVTSANRPLVDLCLERVGLKGRFKAVVTPEGLARSKPDGAIYRRALEQMGCSCDEVLVIEDALFGVMAALDANLRCIWVEREGAAHIGDLEKSLYGKISSWDELKELTLSVSHGAH